MKIAQRERLVTSSDDVQLREAEFRFIRSGEELTNIANMLNGQIQKGKVFLVSLLDVSETEDNPLPAKPKPVKGGGSRQVYCATRQKLFELVQGDDGKTRRIDFVNDETGGVLTANFGFSEVQAAPDKPESTNGAGDETETEDDEDDDEA